MADVSLELTYREFDELQRFVHLAAMAMNTWPVVVGEIVAMKTDSIEDQAPEAIEAV